MASLAKSVTTVILLRLIAVAGACVAGQESTISCGLGQVRQEVTSLLQINKVVSIGGQRSTDFPWATSQELQSGSVLDRRVTMGARYKCSSSSRFFEDVYWVLDVISKVGRGKSGEVFGVVVADLPGCTRSLRSDYIGDHLIVKIESPGASEPLSHEANIMRKMGVDVPHTVQLFAETMRSSGTWSTHAAILMTVARGVPLSEAAVAPEERAVISEQLMSFAKAMFEKHLLHADLTIDNIVWDRESQETTVIDFGNAVDLDHLVTRKDHVQEQNRHNEVFEMTDFLTYTWEEQCKSAGTQCWIPAAELLSRSD